jgi:hypothetical protein
VKAYVASLCWLNQGATVIGAGVDLDSARAIANRYGEDDLADPPMWGPWDDEVDPAEGSVKWLRYRCRTDGTTEPYEWQEIVVVPLAGPEPEVPAGRPPWADPQHDALADIAEIGKVWGAP